MNQRKARLLRKSLGMTVENHRNKEDNNVIDKKTKVVYFRNKNGDLLNPQIVERGTVVNPNLNFYRQQKKLLKQRG